MDFLKKKLEEKKSPLPNVQKTQKIIFPTTTMKITQKQGLNQKVNSGMIENPQ